MPRLLLSTYHAVPDPASGAAVSALTLLDLLAERGWEVRVLSGPRADGAGGPSGAGERTEFEDGGVRFALLNANHGRVPVVGYRPAGPGPSDGGEPTPAAVRVFQRLHARLLDRWQPDLLLTYGGQWVGRSLIDAATARGVRTVFWLRNVAYSNPRLFETCAAVLVPSRFTAEFYRTKLGMNCTAVPSPIRHDRVTCEPAPHGGRRYVTFVNPHPGKGAAVFARIAAELGRRRSDVPLLVVEGRAGIEHLGRYGVDLSAANLSRMGNTPDPRAFYRVSRTVLMPSVWPETFGRVAAEAQLNGIPVLSSDRGGLPETVGEGGLILPLPAELTPRTRTVPAAVAEPWVAAILRLWDDAAYHGKMSDRARRAGRRFTEDGSADRHAAVLRGVLGR